MMKKFRMPVALIAITTLGLVGCNTFHNDHHRYEGYRGEIMFSVQQGENLKLTIHKNNCETTKELQEMVEVVHPYDSRLVVGACVRVTDHGIYNISTFNPTSPL